MTDPVTVEGMLLSGQKMALNNTNDFGNPVEAGPSEVLDWLDAYDKSEVDNLVTGLLDDKGDIDCSANPDYPVGLKGDAYHVTVAGKIGGASGVSVDVSDLIVCKADNAGGTQASVGTSWYVLEHNLVGAISGTTGTTANRVVTATTTDKVVQVSPATFDASGNLAGVGTVACGSITSTQLGIAAGANSNKIQVGLSTGYYVTINNNATGFSGYYNATVYPRFILSSEAAGSGKAGIGFGPGGNLYASAALSTSGAAIYYLHSRSVAIATSNGTALVDRVIIDGSGVATFSGLITATGGINATPRIQTFTNSVSPAPDFGAYDQVQCTVNATTTFGAVVGTFTGGEERTIRITDDGTSRTLAWNAIYRSSIGVLPTATTASTPMYAKFKYHFGDTKWDCIESGGGLAVNGAVVIGAGATQTYPLEVYSASAGAYARIKSGAGFPASLLFSNSIGRVWGTQVNISGHYEVFDYTAGTHRLRFDPVGLMTVNGGITATQTASTGAPNRSLTLTTPAHTALTASTEFSEIFINGASTQQFATGAIATQRFMQIAAPTYSFVGASTITTASTLSISGAPIAGTNATITSPYALRVETGRAWFGGRVDVGNAALGAVALNVFGGSGTSPIATYQTSSTTSGLVVLAAVVGTVTGSATWFSGGGTASVSLHTVFKNSGAGNCGQYTEVVSGSGDAFSNYRVTSAQNWTIGLDQSASSAFKISAASTLGTSDVLTITTAGAATFASTVTATGLITATGGINATPRIQTFTNSASPAPDFGSYDQVQCTVNATTTFGAPTGTFTGGEERTIRITDDGTSRTTAWNAIYRSSIGVLPTFTTAGVPMYAKFRYHSGDTKWDCIESGGGLTVSGPITNSATSASALTIQSAASVKSLVVDTNSNRIGVGATPIGAQVDVYSTIAAGQYNQGLNIRRAVVQTQYMHFDYFNGTANLVSVVEGGGALGTFTFSGSNNGSSSSVYLVLSNTGAISSTPIARTSGVANYFTITTPTDTGITASTEAVGFRLATGTRTWATTGTVSQQAEVLFEGPTYASASASQTFTDVSTMRITKPNQGTNAIFARPHTLVLIDSTSASSSITGGLIVTATLGTAATSVGIGGGNINAGGTLAVGGTSSHTGKATFGAIVHTPQTYTPSAGGTATLDCSLGDVHRITMPAGNITIALSSITDGQTITIDITQDGVGSRTVGWFGTIRWAGGVEPVLTLTANKRDKIIIQCTGSGTYDGFVQAANI